MRPIAGLAALLFDVDGTLYSLPAAKVRFALRFPHRLGAVKAMGREREALRRAGATGPDLWARMDAAVAASLGWSLERAREYRGRFLQRDFPWAVGGAGPLPGLRELLEAASRRGLALGLLSDYPAEEKLRALRLADLPWRARVDASALGAFKPQRAPFDAALAQLGLPAAQVLYVGDREDSDRAGALAVGMPCVLRLDPLGGSQRARAERGPVFRDYAELARALQLG